MPTPKETFLAEINASANKFADAITPPAPTPTPVPNPAPTPTPTPTPPSPSGEPIPLGNPAGGWDLIFADDFNTNVPEGQFPGSVYGAKWFAYPYKWPDTWTKERDPNRKGYYHPKILSVRDSKLIYDIRTENGEHLVAAPCPILPGVTRRSNGTPNGIRFGRYAIRMRMVGKLPGYKIAFLLWPDPAADGKTYWPRDGEIDFPELNLDGESTVAGFMHKQDATRSNDQDWRGEPRIYKPGDWHTYVMEWRSGYCGFFVDGVQLKNGTAANMTDRVPNGPMHVVLQAETNLDGSQQPQDATRGQLEIDWFTYHRAV